MRFGPIRSVLTIAIMLILVSVPTSAVKFTAAAGSSAGVASVSGEYKLQDSASLDSDITLDDSVVSRLSSASGSGENTISEGVSGGGKSVTKTIASDGTFSSDSSDFGCGAGAVSDYKTSLSGSRGSINTVSTGKENQMTVAGGFDGEGDMDVSLTSLAAEEALTTGSASALGTPVFSDNLAQGIRGQDMVVCMQGLYLAGDKELGEFGMVAQNTKDVSAAGKPVGKPQPSPVDYILTGYKWQSKGTGPNIPIVLSIDNLPTGITEASAKAQISAAQTEWDKYSSKKLFSTLGTTTGGTSWDTMDGKNVHLWTSDARLSDNTIAMTGTWANTLTGVAVESDCWYNNRFTWRIDDDGLYGSGDGTVDIRTIAQHELGHTLGLADLYPEDNNYRPSWEAQTMWGYNDGTADWTLNSGDIAGVQKLYGK